jgi:hypothetical protein
MAAEERGWLGLPPSCFLFAFTGYEMSPNSGCDEFRKWYRFHLSRGVGSDNIPSVGSDEHLRFLVSQRHEERARMVAILGNETLADTFDILNFVGKNLEELLVSHPGPSNV